MGRVNIQGLGVVDIEGNAPNEQELEVFKRALELKKVDQLTDKPAEELTEERRKELTKVLKNLVEKGKVSIRNIRRESNDNIKKLLKEKKISEDESKDYEAQIQKNTDENITKIEKISTDKEKEILTL